jgi:excisionase family DNA binding protein
MENVNQQNKAPKNPLWLSVSEAAKIGGVQTKTIRRAIQAKTVKFKIVKNRYLVDLTSLMAYLNSKKKLQNKFNGYGIGQYVEKWK